MANRKRFQFSLLTAAAMMIAAGAIIGLNVQEKTATVHWSTCNDYPGLGKYIHTYAGRSIGCGWPFHAFITMDWKHVPDNIKVSDSAELDPSKCDRLLFTEAFADVLFAWAILAVIYFTCEKRSFFARRSVGQNTAVSARISG